MFTIEINHRDKGPTTYSIYTKNEAVSKGLDYKHWQKANEGDYAITDDEYVALVISKKTYYDHNKRQSFYYRMPFGYIMWNSKYPNKNSIAVVVVQITHFLVKSGLMYVQGQVIIGIWQCGRLLQTIEM